MSSPQTYLALISAEPVRRALSRKPWRWLGALFATCAWMPTSASLVAQVPTALASITTDTGAMAPGRHDFARYGQPGMCVAAAVNMRDMIRMRFAAARSYDTLQFQPLNDTLPSAAVQVARTCLMRFTVANTPPLELENLFDLALLAHNDSLAQAALTKVLQLAPTEPARRANRLQALQQYFGLMGGGGFDVRAEPARPALADAVLADIDHLDPTKPENIDARINAHSVSVTFATRTHNVARVRQDLAVIDTLLHQTSLTKNAAINAMGVQWDAYQALIRLAFQEGPDAMQRVVVQAQQDLQTVPRTLPCGIGWGSGCHTFSVERVRATLLAAVPGEGHPAKAIPLPLTVQYWFPQAPFGRTPTIPLPGTVTLVIQPGPACLVDADFLRYFAFCHDELDAIRRWIQHYGTQHLAIVLVAQARAHATYSGLKTPEEDAAYLRWYFQDFEQLPVTVAVQTPHLTILTDGRRKQDQTGTGLLDMDGQEGGVTVFTPNGTQVWGHPFNDVNDYTDDTDAIQTAMASPPLP